MYIPPIAQRPFGGRHLCRMLQDLCRPLQPLRRSSHSLPRLLRLPLLLGLLFIVPCLVGAEGVFTSSAIPDSVFQRMQGKSWPVACPLRRADFRYLRLSHIDEAGQEHVGEMVCHHTISASLLQIFRQLYDARYPIHSIRLIDDFGADDEASMQANNTSCFCYRAVAGTTKLSKHSQGLAIDLNPLPNPCVRVRTNNKGRKYTSVQPRTATAYTDRTRAFPMKIDTADLAYLLFRQHGFQWGGGWRSLKDYQHFER